MSCSTAAGENGFSVATRTFFDMGASLITRFVIVDHPGKWGAGTTAFNPVPVPEEGRGEREKGRRGEGERRGQHPEAATGNSEQRQ